MTEVIPLFSAPFGGKTLSGTRLSRGTSATFSHRRKPVEIIYVFDNCDTPPADLKAKTVTVGSDIGIYEAWNVALSMCRIPFVMNLNLDDRLASDAVERLEYEMRTNKGNLIGGDWNIYFNQTLRARGHKLFINPKMINCGFNEHSEIYRKMLEQTRTKVNVSHGVQS